jgi:protein-disulfide isomerase
MTLRFPITERDHLRGTPDAPVALVEYGDFECPFCRRAHFILERMLDRIGALVAFAFRHLPLVQIHPHALEAAIAAEAADRQGRFWEMHDRLFRHQDELEPRDLEQHALAVGIDLARFKSDVADPVLEERVRADFYGGIRSGANGTPTFFVGNERYDGPWWDEAVFEATLRAQVREELPIIR